MMRKHPLRKGAGRDSEVLRSLRHQLEKHLCLVGSKRWVTVLGAHNGWSESSSVLRLPTIVELSTGSGIVAQLRAVP